jgi:hypothetical protein
MLAASCSAKPDFTACGWVTKDGFPADSAMGMSRHFGGQSMHPVRGGGGGEGAARVGDPQPPLVLRINPPQHSSVMIETAAACRA